MNSTDNKYGQHGFTLVMSLIILVILTVLSLSSMQSTRLETAMAGNMRESDLAFQSAEMGLQAGESYLQNNIASLASFNNANGLYSNTVNDPDYFAANTWNTAQTASVSLAQLSTNPQFIIKYLGTLPASGGSGRPLNIRNYGGFQPPAPVAYFRVTARGVGQTNSAPRLVQSYFGRTF